jgi:hypothetical protein
MRLSEAEVRAQVEHRLARRVDAQQWAILVGAGWVERVESGEASVTWLLGRIHDVAALAGGEVNRVTIRPQARPRAEVAPHPAGDHYVYSRQDALCLAVAATAANDAEVVAFRQEVLGGSLLTYALGSHREGVHTWVTRQWEAERPQREAFEAADEKAVGKAQKSKLPELVYSTFDGPGVTTLEVVPGGTLDRLRHLGDRLATRYRWQPQAAVAFVLAEDVVPNIDVLTATTQPNQVVPALTRIVLTVDPAATPAAVVRAYRHARNRIAKARAREMQPKTLFLAAFATERLPRESTAVQMPAWNAAVPDPAWRYVPEQKANFVRDRNWALARLLRPEYDLPDQEETITYDDLSSQPDDDREERP